MQRRHLLLAATAGLAAPTLARAQAAPVVMRLSHQFPPSHHHAGVLNSFAEDVKTRTQGGVVVQIYPAEQLARATDNFPGVARGAFEAAAAVNFQWGNTLPEMNVLTIPYQFSELPRIRKFPGSPAAQFLEGLLQKRAVRNLMWLYTTRQAIFTSGKKPLIVTDDFKGVKIRGLNALTDHALTAIGAAPSAMPGPDVPQALQSGVLDAGLTDISAAVSRRFYEFQKFGTVTSYFCVFTHVYVNPRWWGALKPEFQAALSAAAATAEQRQFQVTEDTATAALAELKARGMTVHEQTPAEATDWAGKMRQPVADAFLRLAPENGAQAIELLAAL